MSDKSKNKDIKKLLANALELPKELILDLPHISIIGKEEILVQNHGGLLEYSDDIIRIKTKLGILIINGKNLVITKITNENVQASGKIKSVEY